MSDTDSDAEIEETNDVIEEPEPVKPKQAKKVKIDRKLFADLLTTLEQGSLCAHGGGIPLPVRNALQYFDNELRQYFN